MRNEHERLSAGDEIDLVELIHGLWQQKLLIILTTLLISGVAVAYALLAKPMYEARVFVQSPSQNDIAHLNYGRGGGSGLAMLGVKDVYDTFLRHLQSESLRREFFQTVYLPLLSDEQRSGSQDDVYSRFKQALLVAGGGKDMPSRFSITASSSDPQEAVDVVTRYVEMAGDRAKLEVLKDVKSDATVKANNLLQQIDAAQVSAREQREDEIAQLQEALVVAKSIGLERPPIISGTLSTEVSAGMGGSLTYMRGSKALEAEIANLVSRKSDDPFIENIRKQETELAFYRQLEIDPLVITTFRQDGGVELPDKPVKPRKTLIVVIGVLGGAILGFLLAITRYLWRRSARFGMV